MKQHKINDAWNFIGGWYIDPTICDLIVDDFKIREPIQKEAHSSRGYKVIHSQDMNRAVMSAYQDKVRLCLKEYVNLYKFSEETISAFYMSEPWNVQHYQPGKHYSAWHCENNGEPPFRYRHLAFMTYLNDVTDGGETEFLYQTTKVRPEKGLTLIWPAHWTHTHRGIPSPTQDKYVTTGWYEFFDTENFLNTTVDMEDEDFYASIDKLNRDVT